MISEMIESIQTVSSPSKTITGEDYVKFYFETKEQCETALSYVDFDMCSFSGNLQIAKYYSIVLTF